jgi:hypothetical protein
VTFLGSDGRILTLVIGGELDRRIFVVVAHQLTHTHTKHPSNEGSNHDARTKGPHTQFLLSPPTAYPPAIIPRSCILFTDLSIDY